MAGFLRREELPYGIQSHRRKRGVTGAAAQLDTHAHLYNWPFHAFSPRIRTIPRSRHNPQYDQHTLDRLLANEGIEYVHLAALGGLRHPQKGSPNTGWRNASFRGYADYMQTQQFARAIDDLIARASRKTTALLCAEAVPWRCHRSLVG